MIASMAAMDLSLERAALVAEFGGRPQITLTTKAGVRRMADPSLVALENYELTEDGASLISCVANDSSSAKLFSRAIL